MEVKQYDLHRLWALHVLLKGCVALLRAKQVDRALHQLVAFALLIASLLCMICATFGQKGARREYSNLLGETSSLNFLHCCLLTMCMQHCFSLSQRCLWFFQVPRCDPHVLFIYTPPPPPPPDLDIASLLYPVVLCTSLRGIHGGIWGPRAADAGVSHSPDDL